MSDYSRSQGSALDDLESGDSLSSLGSLQQQENDTQRSLDASSEERSSSSPGTEATTYSAWHRRTHLGDSPQRRASDAVAVPRRWSIANLASSIRLPSSSTEASQNGILQVQYPLKFKALASCVGAFAMSWLANYFFEVIPAIRAHTGVHCNFNHSSLTTVHMLFSYFAWCATTRTLLFVPSIAARIYSVQPETHGFCLAYCVQLLARDGPVYVFNVASWLFCLHLMQQRGCEDNPKLQVTLEFYGFYSIWVSMLWLLLIHWHNKILMDAFTSEPPSGAPPNTINELTTIEYQESLFGNEEGKQYPGECAICLSNWEEGDAIKITPCSHAFHKDCIGTWLRTSRTCALCRQNVAKPVHPPSSEAARSFGNTTVSVPPSGTVIGRGDSE